MMLCIEALCDDVIAREVGRLSWPAVLAST